MTFFAIAMLKIMQSYSFFHCCSQKQSVHKLTILTMLSPYLVKLDTFKMATQAACIFAFSLVGNARDLAASIRRKSRGRRQRPRAVSSTPRILKLTH